MTEETQTKKTQAKDTGEGAVIYCDGACSGNPGPGGWGAILVRTNGTVEELGGGERQTTNNQMELMAATRALEKAAKDDVPVSVCTDSTYVIRGITQWIFGWKRKGWIATNGEPVANRAYWERLHEVVMKISPKRIEWIHVRGHAGIAGNERCDEIAVAFSKGINPPLFSGPIDLYEYKVLPVPKGLPLEKSSASSSSKKVPAFSYLSLIGSIAMRHTSWPECERRVKGHSGAKYQKAKSADDEDAILRSWGVDPKSLKP